MPTATAAITTHQATGKACRPSDHHRSLPDAEYGPASRAAARWSNARMCAVRKRILAAERGEPDSQGLLLVDGA